jgi:hypothetical protein
VRSVRLTAAGGGQRRIGYGSTAGNVSLYGRAESQSRRGKKENRLAEHLVDTGRKIDEWWWRRYV